MSEKSQSDKDRLKNVAVHFESVLLRANEEDIQTVMSQNSDIFFPGGYTISKYRLADEYVTDFATITPTGPCSNDPSVFVSFTEIERADFPLFTRNGDPSAKLTHAIRQVQNWKVWVNQNRDYLNRAFEKHLLTLTLREFEHPSIRHGFRDKYTVYIGRRSGMSIEDRILLSQMNDDLDGIRVLTYDMLLDRMVVASRKPNRAEWPRYFIE